MFRKPRKNSVQTHASIRVKVSFACHRKRAATLIGISHGEPGCEKSYSLRFSRADLSFVSLTLSLSVSLFHIVYRVMSLLSRSHFIPFFRTPIPRRPCTVYILCRTSPLCSVTASSLYKDGYVYMGSSI